MAVTFTLRPASNADQVRDNHVTYLRHMKKATTGDPLVEVLPYIHAWIATVDAEGKFRFAPSKFIGYFEMTPTIYAQMFDKGMDGRVTEKIIAPWVRPLLPEEEGPARDALFDFCGRFGKKPNGRFRITRLADEASDVAPNRDAALTRLLVEVIRALPPEHRQEIARHLR